MCFHAEWLVQQQRRYLRGQLHLSRFKLKDKCRSEKWELYLYGDNIIKVNVLAWKCCPGVCLRFGSSHNLATGHTHSMSCACLLSVAWE